MCFKVFLMYACVVYNLGMSTGMQYPQRPKEEITSPRPEVTRICMIPDVEPS